jgi:glycosyltransferase involved in cell wall biosynthesis
MIIPKMVHIIDPGLRTVGGHYYSLNLVIAEELNKLGIEVRTFGGIGSDIPASTLNFVEAFRFDAFHELNFHDSETYVQENFYLLNKLYLEDFRKIDTSQISSSDLILFQGVSHNQIESIDFWISSIPVQQRPAILIMLPFLHSQMLHNVNRGFTKQIELLYRHSLQKLSINHPAVKFAADTTKLCECFSAISNLPVSLLPSPQSGNYFDPNDTFLSNQGSQINILYVGNMSPYKGHQLLPEIIDVIIQSHPNVRFTVQLHASLESDFATIMEKLQLKHGSRLILLNGVLSQEEYIKVLKESTLVFMPYHPVYYSFGSSGIFVESAGLGKPIVITRGTFADKVATKYNLPVVFADDFSGFSYVEAINVAIHNIESLKKRALLSSPHYSEKNSPRNFIREVFDLF